MKHVMVHAYLAHNLGDDLFVTMLCRRYPKIKFHFLADPSYKQTFQHLKNCRVYSENDFSVRKLNRLFEKAGISGGFWKLLVRRSHAVIHIGGSSFVQHYDDWSSFYEGDRYLAEKSKGLYLIGSNFGPFTDPGYLEAYRDLFRKYRGICLRDQKSYRLFSDIAHVSQAPDVVFGLDNTGVPKKKKVLIAPVYLENRTGKYDISGFHKAYIDFHVKVMAHLIRRGYQITLAGFCLPQGDGLTMQQLFDSLDPSQKSAVKCVLYDQNHSVFDIVREFADSELVIGTRFHSVILGLLSECRVLPVIYDLKTANILEDFHFPLHLQLSELADFSIDQLENTWISLDKPTIERLRTEAEKQFQYTDRLLKR